MIFWPSEDSAIEVGSTKCIRHLVFQSSLHVRLLPATLQWLLITHDWQWCANIQGSRRRFQKNDANKKVSILACLVPLSCIVARRLGIVHYPYREYCLCYELQMWPSEITWLVGDCTKHRGTPQLKALSRKKVILFLKYEYHYSAEDIIIIHGYLWVVTAYAN